MQTAMYQRNWMTDTFLNVVDRGQKGGHAGNRAISLDVWDSLMTDAQEANIEIQGWEIEAALNTYLQGHETGTFVMHDAVNVGSSRKADGWARALQRMWKVHGHTLATHKKIEGLGAYNPAAHRQ